jgi:phosphoglucosamine mutase
MRRLFGTDGVRGIANENLDTELAMRIGKALGTVLSEGQRVRPRVFIGMDTRISSEMLVSAISAGLCSSGCDTMLLGVVTTPAVAYLVKKKGARAGVMISASHNSFEFNGIKIFGEDGFKLSDELEELIESIVLDNSPPPRVASPREIGTSSYDAELKDEYAEYLKSAFGKSLSGLRVGIDCAQGSAYAFAEDVFASLGAECHILSDTPDGININDGCGSTHLSALKELVVREGLDVGVAFDGDADRCLAVDEGGREVDGDFIMAILALSLKDKGKLAKNTVVGTVMTNLGFIRFCKAWDINYISAKVGDRYVLELLNQEGYSFGGEQSGHIIFRDLATTGDGILTAIALLSHIKESGKSLSTLSAVMKKYPQYTLNLPADSGDKTTFLVDSEIKREILRAEEEIGDGRLVIRPSGTEPLIRIMAEGEDSELIKKICKDLSEKIKERIEELKKA